MCKSNKEQFDARDAYSCDNDVRNKAKASVSLSDKLHGSEKSAQGPKPLTDEELDQIVLDIFG